MRFTGERCKLLEKSKENIVYLIQFKPTDQDWVCMNTVHCSLALIVVYSGDVCSFSTIMATKLA